LIEPRYKNMFGNSISITRGDQVNRAGRNPTHDAQNKPDPERVESLALHYDLFRVESFAWP
jgi:hypothetical protein